MAHKMHCLFCSAHHEPKMHGDQMICTSTLCGNAPVCIPVSLWVYFVRNKRGFVNLFDFTNPEANCGRVANADDTWEAPPSRTLTSPDC